VYPNPNVPQPGPVPIVVGPVAPYGVALDVANGFVYWTDSFYGTIHAARLDGSSERVLVDEQDDPRGIALDLLNYRMYWVNYGTQQIRYANLDGTGVGVLVSGPRDARGIAVVAVCH
jgi:DNA-binding beta-propeller fold protein YncE